MLELDESIEDGLIREVAEETGLRVRPIALTGVYKNMPRGIVALVFRCEIAGRAPRTDDEVAEARWLERDELNRMDEAYRVRLLDAVREDPPHVRAHDGTRLVDGAGRSVV